MKRNLTLACSVIVFSALSLKAQEKSKPVENNKEAKKVIVISANPTFPKFEVTGDKEKDNENYRLKKEEWISKHPEEYEKMKEGKDQRQPK